MFQSQCSKVHVLRIDPSPTFTKSLKRDSIYKYVFMDYRRTYLLNINFITYSKADT